MASELDGSATGYTTLSSTLWRLREVLDHLLFKVFETQLVVSSGQTKWLANASRELDAALQEVRHVEIMRAVETVSIADQLGVPPNLTLARLIRSAPSPWDTILLEHREALVELTGDLDRATAALPAAADGEANGRWVAAAGDEPDEIDIVRKFLAETLANAPQASLIAFLG